MAGVPDHAVHSGLGKKKKDGVFLSVSCVRQVQQKGKGSGKWQVMVNGFLVG